jgi:hypothetical protein
MGRRRIHPAENYFRVCHEQIQGKSRLAETGWRTNEYRVGHPSRASTPPGQALSASVGTFPQQIPAGRRPKIETLAASAPLKADAFDLRHSQIVLWAFEGRKWRRK